MNLPLTLAPLLLASFFAVGPEAVACNPSLPSGHDTSGLDGWSPMFTDLDQDGWSNTAELSHGSDPTDARSTPPDPDGDGRPGGC